MGEGQRALLRRNRHPALFMTYQDHLTNARRDAHWRALETMRQREQRALELQMARPTPKAPADTYQQWCGHRREQVEYSLLALAVLALAGAAGVAIGCAMAVWQYGL